VNNIKAIFWVPLVLTCLGAASMDIKPLRAQGTPLSSDGVTIVNTGDRFVSGYRITVNRDGQLMSTTQVRRGVSAIQRKNQMITAVRERFFSDLAKAEPLNKLSTGPGMGTPGRQNRRRVQGFVPAVSGVQVYILYKGQRSPNLRAAGSQSGKALYQDVKHVIQTLHLPIPDVP